MNIPASTEDIEDNRLKAKYASHDTRPPQSKKSKSTSKNHNREENEMKRVVMEQELVKLVEDNQRLHSENEDLQHEL